MTMGNSPYYTKHLHCSYNSRVSKTDLHKPLGAVDYPSEVGEYV